MSDITLDQIRKAIRDEVDGQLKPVEERLNERLNALQHNITLHRRETQAGFSELTKDVSDMVNDIGEYVDKNLETRIKRIETHLQIPQHS